VAIIKLKKHQTNFTQIDNHTLRDKRLSLRAKGMLCQLLSFPPAWQVRVDYLIEQSLESKHVVYAVLHELEQHGYIKKSQSRCKGTGQLQGIEYTVYEESQTPLSKTQEIVKQPREADAIDPLDFNTPLNNGPAADGALDLMQEPSPLPLSDLPEAAKPLPVNQLLLNKEYKNKQIKKETAAIEQSNERIALSEPQAPAAAVFDEQDVLLSSELSPKQQQWVGQRLKKLYPKLAEPRVALLREQVMDCLLDPHSFTQAGQDFFKKLNTIAKVIRSGQWTPPTNRLLEKRHQEKKEFDKRSKELQHAIQDSLHWERLLNLPSTQEDGRQRTQLEQLYQASQSRLAILQAAH